MLYNDDDWVTLYRVYDASDAPYLKQRWQVLAANTRRCQCPQCTYNWTAGSRMIHQADYVLDISPSVEHGDVLLVYEWQLVKPDENEDSEKTEEELVLCVQ